MIKIRYLAILLVIISTGCANNKSSELTQTNIHHENQSKNNTAPLLTQAPTYPVYAAQQGLTGSVRLMFDIDPMGKPVNIRVTGSQPEGIFDSAAIQALARWQYAPKIVANTPQYQRDLTVRLDFNLDKSTAQLKPEAKQEFTPRKPNKDQVLKNKKVIKLVKKGFNLYMQNQVNLAIETIHKVKPTTPFEEAFVTRMLGNFYAELEEFDLAINYLKKATDPRLLSDADQAAAIKLLADINYYQGYYLAAIDSYSNWSNFTGVTDPLIFERIAEARSKLNSQAPYTN